MKQNFFKTFFFKYKGIIFIRQTNEILSCVTVWMNLEDIMLNKISQA